MCYSTERSLLTLVTGLDPQQRHRLDRSQMARERIAHSSTLMIDYYPRESRLVTFRDPWSFPVLFHPGCNHLVRDHLMQLARKVRTQGAIEFFNHVLIDVDRLALRDIGRISSDSLLPAAVTKTRSKRSVFAFGSVCPG